MPIPTSPKRARTELYVGSALIVLILLCFAVFGTLGMGSIYDSSEPSEPPKKESSKPPAKAQMVLIRCKSGSSHRGSLIDEGSRSVSLMSMGNRVVIDRESIESITYIE